MGNKYTQDERQAAQLIFLDLKQGHQRRGVERLRTLKTDIYAAIPDKKRISRGITWVLLRMSALLIEQCDSDEQINNLGSALFENIDNGDKLVGVPIFLMSDYGTRHPTEVLAFYLELGDSESWEVREFTAGGLQKITKANKTTLHPWLQDTAKSDRPNLRRMVSESLRPVARGRWLFDEPEYSLGVLRLLFKEAHPYPRTSVGNNLSDLSKRHPDLILSIVSELVSSGDKNSYWIAYRACRNLVKEQPVPVMDSLAVEEYRYKKLRYSRANPAGTSSTPH